MVQFVRSAARSLSMRRWPVSCSHVLAPRLPMAESRRYRPRKGRDRVRGGVGGPAVPGTLGRAVLRRPGSAPTAGAADPPAMQHSRAGPGRGRALDRAPSSAAASRNPAAAAPDRCDATPKSAVRAPENPHRVPAGTMVPRRGILKTLRP